MTKPLTEAEIKGLKWLVKQGIPRNSIVSRFADFMDTRTHESYEIKSTNKCKGLYFTENQWIEFQKLNPIIIIISNESDDPLYIIKFDKLQTLGMHISIQKSPKRRNEATEILNGC